MANGERVYYTGNMANANGYGTITETRSGCYMVAMDGGGDMMGVPASMFVGGEGHANEFWMASEWDKHKEGRIQQMRADRLALDRKGWKSQRVTT